MFKRTVCLCVCLMGSAGALAQEAYVSGRYLIEGRNATGSGIYRGEVMVVREGETYRLRWDLGRGGVANGTGIVLDKVFSVAFAGAGNQSGIASFRINANGTLTGVWAGMGSSKLGTENWRPVDRL